MYPMPRQQYRPVTAYTVTMPVIVDAGSAGTANINQPPYQALNYKPEGAAYPYVYVPIAQFSRVGAKVNWDERTQTLTVTTDYFDLQARLTACHDALRAARLAYQELRNAADTAATKNKTRFNGMMDGKFVFDGRWWEGPADKAGTFTVGKYYDYVEDAYTGHSVLAVTNDRGEQVAFRRTNFSISQETR